MNFPHHLIPIIFHYWLIQKEEGKNRNNLSKQYGALRSAYLRRHIGLRANNILFLINETSFASSSKDLKRPTGSKFNAFQLSPVSFRNKWRARPPAKTIWKWCLSLSLSLSTELADARVTFVNVRRSHESPTSEQPSWTVYCITSGISSGRITSCISWTRAILFFRIR